MSILTAIPIWGYFVILALSFMVTHVLALRAHQPPNRVRSLVGRIASSALLLLALVLLEPTQPATVLLALLLALLAGVVSGRTASPQLPPRRDPDTVADAADNEREAGS